MHTSYDTALYLFPNACDRILLLLLVHISRQPPSTLPPPPPPSPPPTIVTRANHFAKISHMIRCAACVCLPSSSACICYAMCVMCDVCERDGENAPHKSSEKLFRSKNALRMNAHCTQSQSTRCYHRHTYMHTCMIFVSLVPCGAIARVWPHYLRPFWLLSPHFCLAYNIVYISVDLLALVWPRSVPQLALS